MKRFSNILVALWVTVFLLIVGMKSEVGAQCPAGFTPKTINMNVGGCIYAVDICVKCSPLGLGASEVYINGGITLIPPCTSTLPFSAVVDYLNSQIKNPSYMFDVLCPFKPQAPPCDGPNQPIIVKYRSYLCWKAEVISYFGQNTLYFSTCSDDFCEEIYSVCVDGSGAYQRTFMGTNPSSPVTPSCLLEGYQIEFPEPTIDSVGTTTPCYIYHTRCNQ